MKRSSDYIEGYTRALEAAIVFVNGSIDIWEGNKPSAPNEYALLLCENIIANNRQLKSAIETLKLAASGEKS